MRSAIRDSVPLRSFEGFNERQIAHLIGAQPVSESQEVSDGFGHSLWRLHRECPKTYIIIVVQERERGGFKKQESQKHPKKSFRKIFWRTWLR